MVRMLGEDLAIQRFRLRWLSRLAMSHGALQDSIDLDLRHSAGPSHVERGLRPFARNTCCELDIQRPLTLMLLIQLSGGVSGFTSGNVEPSGLEKASKKLIRRANDLAKKSSINGVAVDAAWCFVCEILIEFT